MNMKQKIYLLNKMRFNYTDKKTGEVRNVCKLQYIILGDSINDNTNFFGYTPLDMWLDGANFDKIPNNFFMRTIEGTFKELVDFKNPLKRSYKLMGVSYEKDNIDLV